MAQESSKPQLSAQNDDLITPRRKALSMAALTEIEQYVLVKLAPHPLGHPNMPLPSLHHLVVSYNHQLLRSPSNSVVHFHFISILTSILLLISSRRRNYTLQGILNPERKGKLFEHFIVTGLRPQVLAPMPFSPLSSPRSQRKGHSRNPSLAASVSSDGWMKYDPEILFCYPESPKYVFYRSKISYSLVY